MPYKSKTTKRPYRKAARKPAAKTRTRKKLSFSTNISEKENVCLKYTEPFNVALSVGNGYTWAYCFRPNDLFDPNYTGGGHQAMMRDQWYTLYEFARCIKYSLKIVIFTDSDSPIDVCLLKTNQNSTIAFEQATETKGAKNRILQKYRPLVLKTSSTVDRALGNKKPAVMYDDAFKQGASAALVDKATVWIQMIAISRASVNANIWTRVYLTQYAQFVEPIYQNQS